MRVKMSKQPPPAPTASTVGPCPTIIQIEGRPGTGRSPRAIAPPDHPPRLIAMVYQKGQNHRWQSTCKKTGALLYFRSVPINFTSGPII